MIRRSRAEIVSSAERQRLHVRRDMLTHVRHVVPLAEQRLGVRRGAERALHPSPPPEVAVLKHLAALRI